MLKVLIADDEKKVCRLIQMLCDWEKLDMELVGIAYNGIQALEMIEKYRPDILITDVCMPGCDGIEVVKNSREKGLPMEVLIISGYADFKYAQSAIRYGVSDYLLKPIKQQELEETLVKLGVRCCQERARLDASSQLLQYMESDTMRRRCSIFYDLLLAGTGQQIPALYTLNERYLYDFVPGIFRILMLKLDYSPKRYDLQAVRPIINGLEDIIREALADCCVDLELCQEGNMSYIICNYTEDNSHLFRQAVRNAVDRIEAKRFQFWETVFSLGMGPAVNDCRQLGTSLAGAQCAVRERLVEGCEKLLEPPDVTVQNDYSEQLDTFKYNCLKAMELYDERLAAACVNELKEKMMTETAVSGTDLLNVVNAAGIYAISSVHQSSHSEKVSEFIQDCDFCSSAEALFRLLGETVCQLIHHAREQHEEEERRPIRIARQYILNHYTEQISLEMVADKAGFSSSYFSSLFKKEAGIGFADYLTQLRMEKAKDLLKSTKTNVKDICVAVGYSDLKHFTATFRKYTGLKPGEFRRLYG